MASTPHQSCHCRPVRPNAATRGSMTIGCSKHAALSAVAVTLWLAAAAHAQTAAPEEGTYCLRGVHEVGSCCGSRPLRGIGKPTAPMWCSTVRPTTRRRPSPSRAFKRRRVTGSISLSSARWATRSTASTCALPATGARSRWASLERAIGSIARARPPRLRWASTCSGCRTRASRFPRPPARTRPTCSRSIRATSATNGSPGCTCSAKVPTAWS